MIKGTEAIQQAYEEAVIAVVEATNCEQEEAALVVETVVNLIYELIKFTGDFYATHKH